MPGPPDLRPHPKVNYPGQGPSLPGPNTGIDPLDAPYQPVWQKDQPNGYAGLDATGNIPASELGNAPGGVPPAGSITTAMIQNGAVTGAKLAPGAADGTALGPDVVTTSTPLGGDVTGTTGANTIAPGVVSTGKMAAGAATGAALGPDVAKLVTGKISPVSQAQQVIATTDLTDVLSPQTPVKGQIAVWSEDATPKLFYISNKRNLRAYRVTGGGFKGDGATDDSAAINQAVADASTKGYVEAPPGLIIRAKNINLASNVVFDGNDSEFKLAASAIATDDVFTTPSFGTLTGGNTTGGVYLPELMHMRINGNGAGRHGIACYGIPRLHDIIIHGCGSNAIWAEWSNTSTELSTLGLADSDQTGHFANITAYDCSMATKLPNSYNPTIQGPTTPTWSAGVATFPFSTPHLRRVGDTVVVSGFTPAGWNGTFSVASVPGTGSFTVAMATNPGAATVVGTVTYQICGTVTIIGMDSPFVRDLDVFQTLGVVPGSRGVVFGTGGIAAQNVHVYQNFATGLDICSGNNTRVEGYYCGGHDQGLLIRQNYVQMDNWFVSGGFANGIGLDYQSPGGACQLGQGRIDTLPSGSICVRLWNTSHVWGILTCVGDGGTNTSTLYTAPNGSAGWHGAIYNLANGLNATPASLVNFT